VAKFPNVRCWKKKTCNANEASSSKNIHNAFSVDGEQAIMAIIANGGPVFAGFDVYGCFMSGYKKASDRAANFVDDVYYKKDSFTVGGVPQTQKQYGGHAIQLYGWGVSESGIKYWWGRNSWGKDWGLDGLFKIKRGSTGGNAPGECGIESAAAYANFDPSAPKCPFTPTCLKIEQVARSSTAPAHIVVKNSCAKDVPFQASVYGNWNPDGTTDEQKYGNCGSFGITSTIYSNGEKTYSEYAAMCVTSEDTSGEELEEHYTLDKNSWVITAKDQNNPPNRKFGCELNGSAQSYCVQAKSFDFHPVLVDCVKAGGTYLEREC
jgi:hypothetical protein